MPSSPIQTNFNAGEISERLRGRFDSEIYKKGLDYCEGFIPTPQGSLLMRSGSKAVLRGGATPPRVFPFRVAGEDDDHYLTVNGDGLRIYTPANEQVALRENLIANSGFDIYVETWVAAAGWPLPYPGGSVPANPGVVTGARVDSQDGWESLPHNWAVMYPVTLIAGHNYRFTARAKSAILSGTKPADAIIYAFVGEAGGGDPGEAFEVSTAARMITHNFTAAVGMTHIVIGNGYTMANPDWFAATLFDDVALVDLDAPTSVDPIPSPWTEDQLDALQLAVEPHRDAGFFFHPNVQPRVIKATAPLDVWEFYSAEFKDQPSAWGGDNWPGAAELGFQGRLFAGSTPNEPGQVWASKVGSSFIFTTGANPDDALAFTISTKGRVVWLQGQKSLLAGGEKAEHSITGSNLMISSGDVNIRDESGFGSAPIQAVHIGDQAIFVARDRRSVRALAYSLQDNGWISKAISFVAEHLTVGGIREVHFAHAPDPMVVLVLNLGGVIACVYDRSEQVIAWWRAGLAGLSARSAAVTQNLNGSELVVSGTRLAAPVIERLPLHEVGVNYLDAWVSGTCRAEDGRCRGMDHLVGATVSIVVEGSVVGSFEVDVDGFVYLPEEFWGKDFVAGLPYVATAITLPRNLKSGKAHSPKIGAVLNRSAIPLLNNWRAKERDPAARIDDPTALMSGKINVGNRGWSAEDKITIKQDLPFRTEILALYSRTEGNEE